jgi:hypothetical protein
VLLSSWALVMATIAAETVRFLGFKTCLRIKMGDDAYNYANLCSGGDIGGPVQPLPADTPNALQCFFLTWGQ